MHETRAARRRRSRPYLTSYGRMQLIRLFEHEMHRLFLKGEVHGTTHLAAGQEAIAVGVCQALEPGRLPRRHLPRPRPRAGQGQRRRGDGRRDARSRHRGCAAAAPGSMNVIDREQGLVGCYGIVGGSIAAATGAALSAQGTGRRGRRAFRRRRHEPGVLLRVPELRQGDGAAARLRLREQLVRRVHADAAGDGGRRHRWSRRSRSGSRARVVDGNDLFARGRGCERGDRASTLGRRADAARVPDLPSLRPLEVRPGEVPAERGGRALAGARPARDRSAAPDRRGASTRTPLEAGRARGSRAGRAAHPRSALAAPYPDPALPATEFAPA